jgi:HK97 gp10 family phage protein
MADDGGIGRLKARLAAIPDAVKAATQPALRKQAEAMADSMRALVPVDSGDLRDSITVTPGGHSTPAYSQPGGSMVVPENVVAVTVGNSGVRYGHLVEYGTAKANASPFFWPTVRLHNKRATAAIKRAISKSVRDNWGSGP